MGQHIAKRIRVMVVDDSPLSQKLYRHIIGEDSRFELVYAASSGKEALDMLGRLKPDVVSMDINMPGMDGVETTRRIMQEHPVPIVVASELYQPDRQEMAMNVLQAGAVSIMPKPNGPGHPAFALSSRRYLNMLKSMSEVKVVRRRIQSADSRPVYTPSPVAANQTSRKYKMIVIGASAGGPESLKAIFSGLSQQIAVPILLVQHIDPHFTEGFCLWLNSFSVLPLQMAVDQQQLLPGHIYLAPGGSHMVLASEDRIRLTRTPPEKGHRPSVSQLFSSALDVCQGDLIAVMLSGMGSDGAAEMKQLYERGALTLAQSRETCLVFGMPGEAIRLGGVSEELPPGQIARRINDLLLSDDKTTST